MFWDDLVDVTTALGRGIYSVGQDIVLGVERTGEGFGAGGSGRQIQIARENEIIVGLIRDLFRYGIDAPQSPLFRIISMILEEYYAKFPEEALRKLAKAAGIGGAYVLGRMVIGKALVTAVAKVIAVKLAASAAYKQLAKKLAVSAGAGATGIGVPITLLMIQGVAQRASDASMRLRKNFPQLHRKLRAANGLDMLFFLVEKPLDKHLRAIAEAQKNTKLFEQRVQKVYQKDVR
jgi:hypothetical protein